jgi:hypothetical protein
VKSDHEFLDIVHVIWSKSEKARARNRGIRTLSHQPISHSEAFAFANFENKALFAQKQALLAFVPKHWQRLEKADDADHRHHQTPRARRPQSQDLRYKK